MSTGCRALLADIYGEILVAVSAAFTFFFRLQLAARTARQMFTFAPFALCHWRPQMISHTFRSIQPLWLARARRGNILNSLIT